MSPIEIAPIAGVIKAAVVAVVAVVMLVVYLTCFRRPKSRGTRGVPRLDQDYLPGDDA